jgi:transposase InsO family protein
LTTAAIVHGLSTDHDRRRGQRCTVLTHPVSLIHRGISVQINRATSIRRLVKVCCADAYACTDALEEAIARYGRPEIFNTDQGSQFTSDAFTGILKANSIQISMDGKGRWMDNVFIERLWRSVKYEHVYLYAYDTIAELRAGLRTYFDTFNQDRTHQGLARQTPNEVYFATELRKAA